MKHIQAILNGRRRTIQISTASLEKAPLHLRLPLCKMFIVWVSPVRSCAALALMFQHPRTSAP